jgi:tetratricopeptide (TPR) repeat protein
VFSEQGGTRLTKLEMGPSQLVNGAAERASANGEASPDVLSPAILKCACGSGLRPIRCCQMAAGAIPLFEAGRHLMPLVERAMQAHKQGAVDTAERLCLDVLELAPNRPGALMLLVEIRRSQGREAAVEALLRRMVAMDPNHLAATNDLTLLLIRKGQLAEAEQHGRNAVRIAPDDLQAHNLLAMIFTELGHYKIGEFHYLRVFELGGGSDPILLANYAWNLKEQGRVEEAREWYSKSVKGAPEVRQTLLGMARLEEADGNFEAADAILNRMETLFPGDADIQLIRVAVLSRAKRPGEALALLQALESKTPGRVGPNETLEKARILDALGRFDEAFAAASAGKQLACQLNNEIYNEQGATAVTDKLRNFFTSARVRMLPRANVRKDVAQPLFILGFPRSGTTLVEQTLSNHSAIAAGDELPLVNELTSVLQGLLFSPLEYPDALSELWIGDQRDGLDRLRDYYLQKALRAVDPPSGAAWFTDKMPLNETHLGLISLIFPAAPLVHVIRHPLDVVLSTFTNHFSHGFFCGSSLEAAAKHYVRIMDLVHHYRSQLTLRYLPVRYEDLVNDQEGTVRSMLDFVGVEYDKRCLEFHQNPRHARTPSYAQVREPLYKRSVDRYRNYLRHLQPVIPILEPTIRRLGYTIK